MDRSHLKVIRGGADMLHPSACKNFLRAFVSDSRLMGVIVLYLCWEADESCMAPRFHQYFYIEALDIGIESYRSLYGDDMVELLGIEQAMLGGLGSRKVEITEDQAAAILQKYAEVNKRRKVRLPDGLNEYGFLLDKKIDMTPEEHAQLFRKTCSLPATVNETINYFLMRLYAGDDEAAGYLARFDVNEVKQIDGKEKSFEFTLAMNTIDAHAPEGDANPAYYMCESLIETPGKHRIIVSQLTVSNGKVDTCRLISDFAISGAEAAMKLERGEFITVYDVAVDGHLVAEFLETKYLGALKRDTDVGRLYMLFNENNDHLKKPVYRLNDDVSGMVYFTDEGQLIVSAYTLNQIRKLEREVSTFPFARRMNPLAKYEFKEDMFYDFVKSDNPDFLQYVTDYFDADDPDDDFFG